VGDEAPYAGLEVAFFVEDGDDDLHGRSELRSGFRR
jgi:hypothetical protein